MSESAYIDISKVWWRKLLFYAAPIIAFLFIFFIELDPENKAISRTMGVALWMALWWIAEIVPLAITSLLPVVLFPLLGVMDGKAVSATYFNHVIFLFIGGFMVALAIERWHFHKRIATQILLKIGVSPFRILLGFMLATSFLSMWISNTATTMMMIPILISIITKLEEINGKIKVRPFAVGLLLATAYSASIGGIATLVGTPPNLSFARIFQIYFPNAPEITFSTWFFFAFPLTAIFFVILLFYMYFKFIRKGQKSWVFIKRDTIKKELSQLGPLTFEEKAIGILFVVLIILWLFRSDIQIGNFFIPGWSQLFSHARYINDGTVAILIAFFLFVIPSKNSPGKNLLDWRAIEEIPWEIILLFGGGFALASGFKESGLSSWVGEQLVWVKDIHPFWVILTITLLVTFLTELTSNTATVETFLPILAGLSLSVETNPLLYMIPATLAGSMAFMLPVATPPNAIIFGTRRLRMIEMLKAGFFLNIVGSILITLFMYYFGVELFGIQLNIFPDWAREALSH